MPEPKPGDILCGPFVVHCYSNGQTMFAGTLDRQPFAPGSEIWIAELQIVSLRRFEFPDEQCKGMRIDQVLTSTIDPTALKPIAEGSVDENQSQPPPRRNYRRVRG